MRRKPLQTKVAWLDRDYSLIRQFKTGVSIHSHTNGSGESLEFVGRFLDSHSLLRYFERVQTAAVDKANRKLDFGRAYWTPPLCPRSAYEMEKQQIENRLGLRALVSNSDHDGIEAPMLLRVVPAMKDVPVSLEWTVPFQSAKFHLLDIARLAEKTHLLHQLRARGGTRVDSMAEIAGQKEGA
jgi:hypothetical protein